MQAAGLYVHIPFCRAKCNYCNFNSYVGLEELHGRYVQSLCVEIGTRARSLALRDVVVDTIYFGGGTPTVLSPVALTRILNACRRSFPLASNCEISLEANPGTVSRESLAALRCSAVNRLSLGAQSFSAQELSLLGRIHTPEQIVHALQTARAVGFDNVNLDLIYGLPGQTVDSWRASLGKAVKLRPEHLSLYALSVEDGTPLAHAIANGSLPPPDPDLAADMYEIAADLLEKAGYDHYELSNWAMPGCRCRHNLKYWRPEAYIGFGAGAHSFLAGERWENTRHPDDYVSRIESGAEVRETSQSLSAAEAMAESMILGLRLLQGVSLDEFELRHQRDLRKVYELQLTELSQLGLLTIDDCSVRLSTRGLLLANQVFARFWPPNL